MEEDVQSGAAMSLFENCSDPKVTVAKLEAVIKGRLVEGSELSTATTGVIPVKSICSSKSVHRGEGAEHLLEDDGKWCVKGAPPVTLSIALDAQARLSSFALQSANDEPNRDPKDWDLVAIDENNGENVIYKMRSDDRKWTERWQWRVFPVNHGSEGTKYELRIRSNHGDAGCTQLGQLLLFEASESKRTPLHVLCANEGAGLPVLQACFSVFSDGNLAKDDAGKTPLELIEDDQTREVLQRAQEEQQQIKEKLEKDFDTLRKLRDDDESGALKEFLGDGEDPRKWKHGGGDVVAVAHGRVAMFFLRGCQKLAALPATIGELGALNDLTLRDCSNLAALPDAIGELRALTYLGLDGCSSLAELPDAIGELRALTKLDL